MFKRAQVLRVNRTVTIGDVTVPASTRVRVNSLDEKTGLWKVRVEDPAQPSLNGKVLSIGESRFRETHRGRPVGSVKIKAEDTVTA